MGVVSLDYFAELLAEPKRETPPVAAAATANASQRSLPPRVDEEPAAGRGVSAATQTDFQAFLKDEKEYLSCFAVCTSSVARSR